MTTSTLLELDHRHGDGIDVTLRFNTATKTVSLAVVDERTNTSLVLPVEADRARYAFDHPYPYAAEVGYLTEPKTEGAQR